MIKGIRSLSLTPLNDDLKNLIGKNCYTLSELNGQIDGFCQVL